MNSPYSLPDASKIDIRKLGGAGGPEYISYNKKSRDLLSSIQVNTGYYWLLGSSTMVFHNLFRSVVRPTPTALANSFFQNPHASIAGNTLATFAFIHTFSMWLVDDQLKINDYGRFTSAALAGALTAGVYHVPNNIKRYRGWVLMMMAGSVMSCGLRVFQEQFTRSQSLRGQLMRKFGAK